MLSPDLPKNWITGTPRRSSTKLPRNNPPPFRGACIRLNQKQAPSDTRIDCLDHLGSNLLPKYQSEKSSITKRRGCHHSPSFRTDHSTMIPLPSKGRWDDSTLTSLLLDHASLLMRRATAGCSTKWFTMNLAELSIRPSCDRSLACPLSLVVPSAWHHSLKISLKRDHQRCAVPADVWGLGSQCPLHVNGLWKRVFMNARGTYHHIACHHISLGFLGIRDIMFIYKLFSRQPPTVTLINPWINPCVSLERSPSIDGRQFTAAGLLLLEV